MTTKMWFLVVPDVARNAHQGNWQRVNVDTAKAANKNRYERPWDYYDQLCGPGHVAVAVSRVPPARGD